MDFIRGLFSRPPATPLTPEQQLNRVTSEWRRHSITNIKAATAAIEKTTPNTLLEKIQLWNVLQLIKNNNTTSIFTRKDRREAIENLKSKADTLAKSIEQGFIDINPEIGVPVNAKVDLKTQEISRRFFSRDLLENAVTKGNVATIQLATLYGASNYELAQALKKAIAQAKNAMFQQDAAKSESAWLMIAAMVEKLPDFKYKSRKELEQFGAESEYFGAESDYLLDVARQEDLLKLAVLGGQVNLVKKLLAHGEGTPGHRLRCDTNWTCDRLNQNNDQVLRVPLPLDTSAAAKEKRMIAVQLVRTYQLIDNYPRTSQTTEIKTAFNVANNLIRGKTDLSLNNLTALVKEIPAEQLKQIGIET